MKITYTRMDAIGHRRGYVEDHPDIFVAINKVCLVNRKGKPVKSRPFYMWTVNAQHGWERYLSSTKMLIEEVVAKILKGEKR